MTWAQSVQLGLVLKIALCHLDLHEPSLRFHCQPVPRFSCTWVIVAALGVAVLRYVFDNWTVWILNRCGLRCLRTTCRTVWRESWLLKRARLNRRRFSWAVICFDMGTEFNWYDKGGADTCVLMTCVH